MLPLLLVVVSLLFLALIFGQVGSAGDQATQTQTAVDSGAVAGAHRLRDAGISQTVHQGLLEAFAFGEPFSAGVPHLTLAGMTQSVCGAASANWAANPHRSGLSCSDLRISASTGAVAVDALGPSGEVVKGPADVTSARFRSAATARVVLARCPAPVAGPAGVAVAHWIAQATSAAFGTPGPTCFTPADAQRLVELEVLPLPEQLAAIGPAQPILDAVTHGFVVEIVG